MSSSALFSLGRLLYGVHINELGRISFAMGALGLTPT